jgi:hypothetical protein
LPANTTPAITSSEVTTETIGQPTRDGERYPQTRQRLLAIEDINGLNAAEVRYAINEIYARHGATFPNHPEIQQQFKKFDWYHPDANLSFNDIDQLMSDIERENVKTLAQYRANTSQSESQAPIKQREAEERQAQADMERDAQDVRRNLNNPYVGNETGALTRQGLKIKNRALQIQAEKKWLREHGFQNQ